MAIVVVTTETPAIISAFSHPKSMTEIFIKSVSGNSLFNFGHASLNQPQRSAVILRKSYAGKIIRIKLVIIKLESVYDKTLIQCSDSYIFVLFLFVFAMRLFSNIPYGNFNFKTGIFGRV